MNILDTSLFASSGQRKLGLGFHNIGARGVLRASNTKVIGKVQDHYGERCGHIPLNTENTYVLVEHPTANVHTQMAYLSHLFDKQIKAITSAEFHEASAACNLTMAAEPGCSQEHTLECALVVPYINVPEAEQWIRSRLNAESWGLAGKMVSVLKNKADFYQLLDELSLDGFQVPDYQITNIADVPTAAFSFLGTIEDLLKSAGIANYPLGVMLRAAESDGNYGCCLMYEQAGQVKIVQDGEVEQIASYPTWQEALAVSQHHLAATMNPHKETRVVISRFLDFVDSPGMSVVIMKNQVESLGWNGQLQKEGSKACVGTSTYQPKSANIVRWQREYEDQTTRFFETLLRKTSHKLGIDFASLRGVANIDIMLPSRLEMHLQKKRGRKPAPYIAECNPRWTNYTDAIMTAIGVGRKEQTIRSMRAVIQEGIASMDKYVLPHHVDPQVVRDRILARDAALKQEGTRIICRMAKNPMGLIFTGDVKRAEQEVATIIVKDNIVNEYFI